MPHSGPVLPIFPFAPVGITEIVLVRRPSEFSVTLKVPWISSLAAHRAGETSAMTSDVAGSHLPELLSGPCGCQRNHELPTPKSKEEDDHRPSMNDTVKKFIKNQAAMSSLYFSSTQGYTESFLQRPHSSRDLLGACLADSSFPDGAKKRLIQSVGLQFPCRALLHQSLHVWLSGPCG